MRISVLRILRNVFAIVSILLAAFVLFLICTGTRGYAVQTDSMLPVLHRGDAVFVRAAAFAELRENDVITATFPESGGVFTHRVVRVDAENQQVYTRGDHNMADDPMPTDASRIIGKLWFSVPYLGFLSLYLKSYTVLYIALGVAIALIVLRMVLSLRKRPKS